MRVLWLACLIATVGCSSSKEGGAGGSGDSAVETYVNGDLVASMAQLLASRKATGDLTANHIDEGMGDYLRMRIDERAIPTMDAFLTEVAKVTPPESMAAMHSSLVEIAGEERAALAELSAALDPISSDGWKAGHAKMMSATERATRWEINFTTKAKQAGVRIQPVERAKYPDQLAAKEPAPPEGPCGTRPCPCEEGSEVKEGDVLRKCVLTSDKHVGEQLCSPGVVTFRADGSFESCVSAVMFMPFEVAKGTPKTHIAVCGFGRVSRGPGGKVTTCVVAGDIVAGEETIAKGSTVTFDATGAITASQAP